MYCILPKIYEIDTFDFAGDIYKYCQHNPHGVIANQNNAALYYDCTQYNSSYGHYLRECPYPQLFSINSQKCEDFITVTPDKRPVPQAPCKLNIFFNVIWTTAG